MPIPRQYQQFDEAESNIESPVKVHKWLRLINAAIYRHLTHMTFLTDITFLISLPNQN